MHGDDNIADPGAAEPAGPQDSPSEAAEAAPAPKKPLTLREHARQPVGLIVLAVVFLVGVYFGMHAWLGARSYQGEERVQELVQDLNYLDGSEFEEVRTPAGELNDWMFLTSGLDEFKVPGSFASVTAIACRVRQVDGKPVVQIVFEAQGAILQIFRIDDFAVQSRRTDEWVLQQYGDWASAFQQSSTLGYIVSFPGSREEMQTFLADPAGAPVEG